MQIAESENKRFIFEKREKISLDKKKPTDSG